MVRQGDTWEDRLYKALSEVLEHTSNYDGIPCDVKEHAERIMNEWAGEQIRKNAEKVEDLPEC